MSQPLKLFYDKEAREQFALFDVQLFRTAFFLNTQLFDSVRGESRP